jgi:hypothetical protein
MNILDEYRRNAQECQRMAEKAGNAADKASWLRLAASWLGMIQGEPRRIIPQNNPNARGPDAQAQAQAQAWPVPSKEDSKASH